MKTNRRYQFPLGAKVTYVILKASA